MKRAVVAMLILALSTGCTNQKIVKPLPKSQNIVIDFAGDTNGVDQISKYLDTGASEFSNVAKELGSADLSVVNLETAVTNATEHQVKEFTFNSNPLLLDKLASAGVDVVNMANNHAGDYFRVGVSETIKASEAAGLKVIGAGNNGREAWTAKIFDIRGTKIALLGIAKVNGGVATVASGELAGTTDGWNNQVIELAIKAALRQAKTVILYVHWGVEGQECPAKDDVASAQKWLDYGASAIIGSHSHRQQPVVRYGEKIVDYSLGNFSFYVRGGDGLKSGIGQLILKPTGEVLSYKFMPAIINPSNGAPSLLSGAAASAAIAKKQTICY